jgi:hypothetical protein
MQTVSVIAFPRVDIRVRKSQAMPHRMSAFVRLSV